MIDTQYRIPEPVQDQKPRFIRITDPEEIAAMLRGDMDSPIGDEYAGAFFAEAHSLAQYRKETVEIAV